jgi:hypothetical protein
MFNTSRGPGMDFQGIAEHQTAHAPEGCSGEIDDSFAVLNNPEIGADPADVEPGSPQVLIDRYRREMEKMNLAVLTGV